VLALEVREDGFQCRNPGLALGLNAFFTNRQAEQLTIEQAHQTIDIGLRELFAQACVAVVVRVIELLANRFEALLQVA